MGCSAATPYPPIESDIYKKRHQLLFHYLLVTDLVKLIESFIPLKSSDRIPLWYLHKGCSEFYQSKPKFIYAPVVWNYYACHHKGIELYVLIQKPFKESIWTNPTQLKLQIFEHYFSDQLTHPKCLCGLRTIIKDQPLNPYYYNIIISHLDFWISIVRCHVLKYDLKELELAGFFPVVWIIYIYILRSSAPIFKKKLIIRFLLKYPFFAHEINKKWTTLAGEFSEALRIAPTGGNSMFLHILELKLTRSSKPILARLLLGSTGD